MRIKFSPMRMDDTLVVSKDGNALTINGEVFDFSGMPDGVLPSSAVNSFWVVGDVIMKDGELCITLILPLPANYSQEQAFPEDILDVPDGNVRLPKPLKEVVR